MRKDASVTGYLWRQGTVLLPASVEPRAAFAIVNKCRPILLAEIGRLTERGDHLAARELTRAVAQLVRAADQVVPRSEVGRSDGPRSSSGSGSSHLLDSGLTTGEVARQLSVTERQVRRMVTDGKLRATWVRGRWEIDAASVAELEADRADRSS